MAYRVQLHTRVKVEIRREGIYLGERSKAAEGKWRSRILLAIKHLERHPERYPPAYEAADLGFDLREYQIGNKRGSIYRVLFTIDGDIVNILWLRHAAQDWVDVDEI